MKKGQKKKRRDAHARRECTAGLAEALRAPHTPGRRQHVGGIRLSVPPFIVHVVPHTAPCGAASAAAMLAPPKLAAHHFPFIFDR